MVSSCEEISTAPIGLDEATMAGTARGLVDVVAGEARVRLTWYGHDATSSSSVTEVRLEVSAALDTARLVEQRSAEGLKQVCQDFLAVDADLLFQTTDGVFDEIFRGRLVTEGDSTVRFIGALPAANLTGSYDASTILSNYVDPEYTVRAGWSAAPSGDVSLSGGDADDDPSTTVVSAAVAEFGGEQP